MLIRQACELDAEGIARVHVDAWRSTYRGIVPDDVLDGLSYEKRQARWNEMLRTAEQSRHHIWVAADLGRIVGFADGGREREGDPQYTGELYAIYILPEYQRKGTGRGLLGQIAARLVEEGHEAALVWVLADNPYRRFYERMGAVPVRTKEITIGGTPLTEVAYGWPDLRQLVRNIRQSWSG